jgi:hypothetical protein
MGIEGTWYPSPGENKEKRDLGEYWEVERSKGFGSESSKESEGSLQKDRIIDLREKWDLELEIKVVGGFYGSGCSQLLLFLGRCLFAVTMFGVNVSVGKVFEDEGFVVDMWRIERALTLVYLGYDTM